MQRVTIKGSLVTLNDHDNANRANKFGGAKLKKDQTEYVAMQLGRMKKVTQPSFFHFHWFISGRHDPDNVAFAKKFILDGMQLKNKLENDNQKWVLGFSDYFIKVKKGEEKIVVEIE